MYDAHDAARRETNNIIAHHPQELQDRFYDAQESLFAVSRKTDRVVNIINAVSTGACLLPVFVGGMAVVIFGVNFGVNNNFAAVAIIVGLVLSAVLLILGFNERSVRKARQWEQDTLAPYEEEYGEVAEEICAYQRANYDMGL